MKIIVQKNLESAKVEIDTKNCSYQWGFRDAIILAMEIEGFHKSFIVPSNLNLRRKIKK